MGQIFDVEGGWKFVIYTYGKRIFSKTFQYGIGKNNRVLKDDYVGELSVVKNNSMLYYGYKNRNGSYILYRLSERSPILVLKDASIEHCKKIQLVTWKQSVYLICVEQRTPKGVYEIKGYRVTTNNIPWEQPDLYLNETFNSPPKLHFMPSWNALFLCIKKEEDFQKSPINAFAHTYSYFYHKPVECFCWEQNGPGELLHSETVWHEYTRKKWDELSNEYQQRQESQNQLLIQTQKEKETLQQLLQEEKQQTLQLRRDMQQKDEILDSVKKQYEELMETAIHYREAAKKHSLLHP